MKWIDLAGLMGLGKAALRLGHTMLRLDHTTLGLGNTVLHRWLLLNMRLVDALLEIQFSVQASLPAKTLSRLVVWFLNWKLCPVKQIVSLWWCGLGSCCLASHSLLERVFPNWNIVKECRLASWLLRCRLMVCSRCSCLHLGSKRIYRGLDHLLCHLWFCVWILSKGHGHTGCHRGFLIVD